MDRDLSVQQFHFTMVYLEEGKAWLWSFPHTVDLYHHSCLPGHPYYLHRRIPDTKRQPKRVLSVATNSTRASHADGAVTFLVSFFDVSGTSSLRAQNPAVG